MSCIQCLSLRNKVSTSALVKVLLTLKLLQGSRIGAKGLTLEDIAMHMIKHFSLDGDIKSQVLASLKYGVKMHFIRKRKEKFSLIMPGSSIQVAPCNCKSEEIDRLQCIFPAAWQGGNTCGDMCSANGGDSTCGRSSRKIPDICCEQGMVAAEPENTCALCRQKTQPRSQPCPQPQHICPQSQPYPQSQPCPTGPKPCPPRRSYQKCPETDSSSESPCNYGLKKSKRSLPCSSDNDSSSDDRCSPRAKKRKRSCTESCRTVQPSECSRRRQFNGDCPSSPYDDYCLFCSQGNDDDDDDMDNFPIAASVNCRCNRQA